MDRSMDESSDEIEVTTQTIFTTTVATWEPATLNLTTTVLVVGILIATFALVLFFKYQIVTSNYKSWSKILRRSRRATGTEEGNEGRNEIWFQPPPEYDIAVNMDKPCNYCSANGVQASTADAQCECNREKEQKDSEKEGKDTDEVTITITPEMDEEESCCASTSNSVNTTETCDTDTTVQISYPGPFLILDHVQRMNRDTSASLSRLPTYAEYAEEFPDNVSVSS